MFPLREGLAEGGAPLLFRALTRFVGCSILLSNRKNEFLLVLIIHLFLCCDGPDFHYALAAAPCRVEEAVVLHHATKGQVDS